jgi:hypothetical protein
MLTAPTTMTAHAAGTGASLQFVPAAGHRIAVRGDHWAAGDTIVFAVRYGSEVAGVELRAGSHGKFVVAADTIDLCSGVTFDVHDLAGRQVLLRGPELECPSRVNPPRPSWTVLRGKRLHPHRVHLVPGSTRVITMRLGELLTLRTSRSGIGYTPQADATHLAVVREDRAPADGCPDSGCPTVLWRWAAVAPGDTVVLLSADCRRSVPPCELPDQAIRVKVSG